MRENYVATIVGCGAIGSALAHDLVLRGFKVILIDRGDLISGVTSLHHGVLHSGARYAVTDPTVAKQCITEMTILRKIAPGSIPNSPAIFVGLSEEDTVYARTFNERCREVGIPTREISVELALSMEPHLTPLARMAVEVPDVSVEPTELPRRFINTAISNGASVYKFAELKSFLLRGSTLLGVSVAEGSCSAARQIYSDVVINAAGPWAKSVCELAGTKIPAMTVAGVLYSVAQNLCSRVIGRLHNPGDADTIVPRSGITIFGSNSWPSREALPTVIPDEFVEHIRAKASDLMPICKDLTPLRVWAASRTLCGEDEDLSGRELSRNFRVIDHSRDGLSGFFTLIGGKATTARNVAEVAADTICEYVGISRECSTRTTPLLPAVPHLG